MSDQPFLPNLGAPKPDLILLNAPITDESFGSLIEIVSSEGRSSNLILILVTLGGTPNSGYRIARLCQDLYESFEVFVPSFCKSAGTLVALGANKLYMTPFSELGPLDVQLIRPDELGERRSGLVNRSALEALADHSFEMFDRFLNAIKTDRQIRYRLAAEIASGITMGLMSEIYSQIVPSSIGEDYRDLQVALEYGKRLIQRSGNIDDKGLYKLVHRYPSHDFVIDHVEARTLFKKVENAPEFLYRQVMMDPAAFMQPKERDPVIRMLSYPAEPASAGDGTNGDDHEVGGEADAESERA